RAVQGFRRATEAFSVSVSWAKYGPEKSRQPISRSIDHSRRLRRQAAISPHERSLQTRGAARRKVPVDGCPDQQLPQLRSEENFCADAIQLGVPESPHG